MKRNVAVLIGASAVAALAAPAAAQIPLNARALGTGGAYLAAARGYESVFTNPAHLGLADRPGWSLSFPQVALGLTSVGPELADVRDYLDYDDLSDQQRQDLLARIPAEGTALEGDVRAPLFSYQKGGFGLGVAYGFLGRHTVGKDLVDLFLNGYQQGRTDYSIGNTSGSRATFWDFAAAYGRGVGPLSVGATAHYYLGRSLVQTRAFEPRYNFITRDIEIDYVGVRSESGSGFGVDLGAALEPVPGLTLSATIANAFSSMEWDDELVGRKVTLTRADFRDSEFQVIRNRYEQSDQDLGSEPSGQYATVAQGLTDDAQLPTTLKLGAAFTLPGASTTLTGAYQDNLSEGRLGGSWSRLLGVGIQQGLPIGAARVGISSDLEEGSIVGGGLTLGPVDLGLARFENGEVGGASRNGWIASFGLSVRAP